MQNGQSKNGQPVSVGSTGGSALNCRERETTMSNSPDIAQRPAHPVVATGPLFGVWIPVADQLPKTGQRVLVTALNGLHVWRTVAQYWPAGTMDASDWDDPPEDWWDTDGNTCTNPEPGWYEAQIETEVQYLLHGVSHWMPLPPSPNTQGET